MGWGGNGVWSQERGALFIFLLFCKKVEYRHSLFRFVLGIAIAQQLFFLLVGMSVTV